MTRRRRRIHRSRRSPAELELAAVQHEPQPEQWGQTEADWRAVWSVKP